MTEIFNTIKCLPRIGTKRLALYEKLDIYTPYDLLCHYPRTYVDFKHYNPIDSYSLGSKGLVRGRVTNKSANVTSKYTIYKNYVLETGTNRTFEVTIFNNAYANTVLCIGSEYLFYGKIDVSYYSDMRCVNSPTVLPATENVGLQPTYSLTSGLTNVMVQNNVKQCLDMFNREPFEPLSPEVLEENGLLTYQEAINMIHFPSDALELKMARRRLAFDELLLLQLGFGTMKVKSRKNTGCTMHSIEMDEFFDRLPFTMTKGQLSAIEDITHDMCSTTPMNRLIQGDVGSGKTAVAMAGCYFAYKNGFQSTIMAPTEILAQQHYETFKSLLEPLGMRVGLLTGSLTQKNKKLVRQKIADGELDVVTGTHALVQKDTIFQNLGLVITDEQHRFGVSQRAKLSSKGNYPHTLVMSATPIPRTLGLIIYGDLDISPIKELPAGRQPIETYAVMGKLRERAYNYVVKHLKEGGQAYIVCPTIEENEMELQSVYAYAENLKDSVLGRYNIGILHGRMSQEEKDTIMLRFKIGIIDILISTTVIEVGVDVPNASIILIENAERFGLSQLHQLRGRVGRGSRKSACILLCNNYTDDAKERLRAMCNTTDGFEIAEKDLEIRGYGDFFGHRQHGLPSLKVANLVNDSQILDQSKVTAQKILSDDPTLSKIENAILASQVARMFDTSSST